MLTPAEFKNRTFKKNLGGYNAAEIDSHLVELYENYEIVYCENAELVVKNDMLLAKIAAYKQQEDALKTAVRNVRLLCDGLIEEANTKSEQLVASAMNRRDEILYELEKAIKDKKNEIKRLNDEIAEYKDKLLFHYKIHYENINKLPTFELIDEKQLAAKADSAYQQMRGEEVTIPIIVSDAPEEPEISEIITEETEQFAAEQAYRVERLPRTDEIELPKEDKTGLEKVIDTPTPPKLLITDTDEIIRKEIADFVKVTKDDTRDTKPLGAVLGEVQKRTDEIPIVSRFADDIRFGANYVLQEPPKKKGLFGRKKNTEGE